MLNAVLLGPGPAGGMAGGGGVHTPKSKYIKAARSLLPQKRSATVVISACRYAPCVACYRVCVVCRVCTTHYTHMTAH